jgi:hypothetical protein
MVQMGILVWATFLHWNSRDTVFDVVKMFVQEMKLVSPPKLMISGPMLHTARHLLVEHGSRAYTLAGIVTVVLGMVMKVVVW